MSNKKRLNIKKTDVLIFLIIVVIFSMSLLSFFPGLLTSDVVDQLAQAKVNKYLNAHPIFHSFVIGNLAKLGGIWVPEIFQILVFAIIWAYACKKIRTYNPSTKNKIFQILFTIIICIIPLNFLYSITLWKDILYSYSILAILIFVYIGIKEKFRFTILQAIMISIASVAIMKFRHNGLPIGFFMFILLFILNLKNNRNLKQSITLITSFILTIVLMSMPKWIWEQKQETTSVAGVLDCTRIYCMGAILGSDTEIENQDKEFLNLIMNIDEWKESYDSYTGGPILYNPNLNLKVIENLEGNKQFHEIFTKYAMKNKLTVLKHFLNVNSIWWSIEEKGGMHSIILSNNYLSQDTGGIYDNHPIFNTMNKYLGDYTIKTLQTKWLYELLYRPATAIIVSIVCVIAICIKKKNVRYILLLFPMILNIGTYIFIMSSQDQRYFYPCFITAYFSVLIFGESFIKQKQYEITKKK